MQKTVITPQNRFFQLPGMARQARLKLQKIRERGNNSYLKAVIPSDMDKKLQLYHQYLSEPFKEITEEDD